MRLIPLALLPALLLTANVRADDKLSADSLKVAKDGNAFACDLYRQLARQEGNLFFSPYSISTALAMTYAGARGETAAEMAKTLHFDLPAERLHAAFAELLQATGSRGSNYKLQIANRLWGQKDYGFFPAFLKLCQDHYGAGLKEVDFAKTEEARLAINDWVAEQTQQKIKELVKPGILEPLTRLVLTNAIYFKAAWATPFDPRNTKDGEFTVAEGKKIKTPLMAGMIPAGLANLDDFQALELPYVKGDLSMLILLPRKSGGLPGLEKNFNVALLDSVDKAMGGFRVDVKLPKFKVTAEFKLNEELIGLGMVKAFDPDRADFGGLAPRARKDGLHIHAVVHKAFVDVNEAGTEAAAATAVVIKKKSDPQPGVFHATHPFLYVIRDNRTGSVLFAGRVANPAAP